MIQSYTTVIPSYMYMYHTILLHMLILLDYVHVLHTCNYAKIHVNKCAFYTGSPFTIITKFTILKQRSQSLCYSMGIVAHINSEINYFQDIK